MGRQALAQHQPSSQYTGLQSGNTYPQGGGCIFGRKLINIAQHYGNPIFLWQPENCLSHELTSLRGGQELLRIFLPALNLAWTEIFILILRQRFRRSTLTKEFGSSIDRDACQPGRKLRPPLKTFDMFIRLQEHVLHHVSNIVHVPYNSRKHAKYAAV